MAGTHTLVTITRPKSDAGTLGTTTKAEREPVLSGGTSSAISNESQADGSVMWSSSWTRKSHRKAAGVKASGDSAIPHKPAVNNLQWFNRTMWDYGESMWDQHDRGGMLTLICTAFGVIVVVLELVAVFLLLVLVGCKDHWDYNHWAETDSIWLADKGPPGTMVWVVAAVLTLSVFLFAIIWGYMARHKWTVLSVIFVCDIVAFLLVLAEINLLTSVHVSSAISTVGSSYALLGTMRASRSNVRASLLWNVAFNDLLSSIGRFVPARHCQIQAIIISTGDVGSVFWVAGIANLASFIMGNAMKLRMTTRMAYASRRNRIICVIWTWTVLSVTIPFFTDSYGMSTDDLCWVKDDSVVDKTMQFIQFYAPLCAVMLYCLWVYRPSFAGGIIWQVMSSNERFRGSGTSGHVSNPRVLIVYPLYLLVAWLPGFMSGLVLRSVTGGRTNGWLQNLQTVNKSLMGMANAMIYYHLDPKLKNDLMRFCGSRSVRHSEHAEGAGSNKMPFRFQSSRSHTDDRWSSTETDKETSSKQETWGTISVTPAEK